MACRLANDPSGLFDVLGKKGDTPTVFIESDASLVATVSAATQNGVAVPILPGGRVKLRPLESNNILNLILLGVEAGNDIHLMEECGNSETVELSTKNVGGKPGQANPNMGFTIHAT